MATHLELEVVTPFGKTYDKTVTSCVAPGVLGQFQVLRDHAAMLSVINIGLIKIEEPDGKTVYMATSGGFCEIRDNRVKLIVESAEYAQSIDVARAEAAIMRAEKRLDEPAPEVDVDRARLALARALNRLKISRLR